MKDRFPCDDVHDISKIGQIKVERTMVESFPIVAEWSGVRVFTVHHEFINLSTYQKLETLDTIIKWANRLKKEI